MGLSGDAGEQPGQEDFEQFLEIRGHVQRMQAGTPLLLRSAKGSQEELQICTFWVTKDLKALKWREQEGSGDVREVALNSVLLVAEEDSKGADDEEDGHYALSVSFRGNGQGQAPNTMSLICASPEDLLAWRDGLKFLVGATSVGQTPPLLSSPVASPPAAARQLRTTVAAPEANEDLRRKLKEQVEANDMLKKENDTLREVVKRKDVTIADLIRDLQNRSATADRCNKTESTSRESDEHLRDREVAILQRKNRKLRKTLQEKQRTIAELLKLVGNVTAQQGAESSAVEDGNDNEDEDSCAGVELDATDDGAVPNGSHAAPLARDRPAAALAKAPAKAAAPSLAGIRNSPKPIPGGGGARAGALAASLIADVGEPADESEEAAMEEVRTLAGQLERLERDLAGLTNPAAVAAPAFKPPPRATAAGTAAAARDAAAGPRLSPTSAQRSPQQSPTSVQSAQLAAPASSPASGAPPAGFPAGLAEMLQSGNLPEGMPAGLAELLLQGAGAMLRNGPPSAASTPAANSASCADGAGGPTSQGSAGALQALEREMALLEEKKRVVEQLARKLEPPSDEEDDDSFLLH